MSDEYYDTTKASSRIGARVRVALTGLAFLALLGVVGYLLADRNHRTYSVERKDNTLVVMRGMHLPVGAEPFAPADRTLAETYAPIPVENDSTGELVGRAFADRDELDRALYRTIAPWISARLAADTPEKLSQAVAYLHRVERLTGLSDDQRRDLGQLRAEAGYFEGKAKLEESVEALKSALERLELAATSRSRHAREAAAALLQVQEPIRAVVRAARLSAATTAVLASPGAEAAVTVALPPPVFGAKPVESPPATPGAAPTVAPAAAATPAPASNAPLVGAMPPPVEAPKASAKSD